MNRYLLEVGVEEFPSRFIESTKRQLLQNLLKYLEERGLMVASSRVESTPRRFAVWLEDLKQKDSASEETLRGPSVSVAYDAQGAPSKALQGFMRSKGVGPEAIFTEGDYVFARVSKEVVSIESILKEAVPKAIRAISNPRSMRWGGKNLRFLRPIRWLLSLYNDEVLPFSLEEIPVGRMTRGHRFLGKQELEIPTIDAYEEMLRAAFVIVDEEERRAIIVRGLNKKAREHGGVPMEEEELLSEVVHIVEYPTVFIGKIPKKYLSLPQEVIITPMKDHQRYFPVLDDEGKLLPYFLSVRNGNEEGLENVIAGNEKVLVPRLEDARFFYDHDRAHPLEENLLRLDELIFHEQLGTMLDKTKRLESLVVSLSKDMECGPDTEENVKRAAYLSKADLVTEMVVEFTELQGVMGRIYAESSGEKALVAQAIEEQYQPIGSDGSLPKSTIGTILSLADKVDNIAGLFAIEVEISGSQDPFGLRRAANGMIDMIQGAALRIDLEEAFRDALVLYVEQQGLVFDYDVVMGRIYDFLFGRLRTKLSDAGVRYDVIDAVLLSGDRDLLSLMEKAMALQKWLEKPQGQALITDFVRVASLAKNDQGQAIDEASLTEGDRAFLAHLEGLQAISDQIKQGCYEEALTLFEGFMPAVNDYLDATMILVDEDALRGSRLAMLKKIDQVIGRILLAEKIVRD